MKHSIPLFEKSCNPSGKYGITADIMIRAELEKISASPFNSREKIGYFLTWLFANAKPHSVYAVFFDGKMRTIGVQPIEIGERKFFSSVIETIESGMKALPSKQFVIAHNHVNKPLVPSPEDLRTTYMLTRRFNSEFIDHYIISDFSYITIAENSVYSVRNYSEASSDDVKR